MGEIKLSTCQVFITNGGEYLVVSDIIRTFVLSVVKFETGQGNKFFSKRVYSDLLIYFPKTKV